MTAIVPVKRRSRFGFVKMRRTATPSNVQVRRILTNPKRLRLFNWTMAVLLVGSLILIL